MQFNFYEIIYVEIIIIYNLDESNNNGNNVEVSIFKKCLQEKECVFEGKESFYSNKFQYFFFQIL